ncbi:MAG TPA: F0F1 ATP synthase subunit epsilon [Candidatus Binatia bacterium]|jgi:F-type H+-transporting ATPase subunit epsilon|nr:F0F1 ATP synthase subunit epsilon [Candidatus Binatia bacterium]
MADKIRLRVVTPSRLLLDDVVDEVTAPGALGEFGVLPDHIAFLTLLVPGEMSYKEGTARHYLAVSGGYAEVLDNVMTVLAPAAEFAGEINTDRARQAKESAEKRMAELNYEDKEFNSAATALEWANARLQVAGKEARR